MIHDTLDRIGLRRDAGRLRLADLFLVVVRWQTYLNLCYLLAALPLGAVYFMFLVPVLATGASTLLIGVGIPICLLALALWLGLGSFERELSIWWLHVDIPPMAPPRVPGLTLWRRLRACLRRRVTWTSLVYLLVKFPFGLLVSLLLIALIAVSTALITAPLALLVRVSAGATTDLGTLTLTLLSCVAGLGLGLLSLHGANAAALGWGQFTRLMLGMSNADLRVAEARAVAARERGKAERAEQSRRELIVNVSHELRTPIASIRGHVESLLMAADEDVAGAAIPAATPAELHSYLGIIHRETERLGALVDDLLSLARAEAGELHLEIVPVAVGEVVEEVYQALAPLARRERQVTLVREMAPALPLVLADRQRLAQVLLNLARNAITYTPTGGIVSLAAARADAGHVALTVADTGIGIPPEDLARVFERFYRTDTSRARASGGFGLGLAIVRDLVTAMGGSITAASTQGEGSQFRVLLPTATSVCTLARPDSAP
jgi:two-component system, OmpR family, phosphate regulon sensor histidine kinase PhoR